MLSALALADAQAASLQPFDELAVAHRFGARLDEGVVAALRHVVVVAVEGASRESGRLGEGVQFVERGVAHEVRP